MSATLPAATPAPMAMNPSTTFQPTVRYSKAQPASEQASPGHYDRRTHQCRTRSARPSQSTCSGVSSWKVEWSMSKSPDRQSLRAYQESSGLAVRPEDDVGRDDVHAARDGPGMEVVDGLDAGGLEDVPPDLVEVHALGRGLEEHVDSIAEQMPRARDDEQRDEHRGDGVRGREARDRDEDRGDDDSHEPEEVTKDLEIGATHVQAARLRVTQQQE